MDAKMDASFDGKPPRNMTNVQVVVRCRPASVEERARGVHETVHCDTLSQEVRVALSKAGEKVFTFDKVYDPHSTQREIYDDVVEPLVQQTLRGYNTTVLAYGQTGTGKTHTMEGEIENSDGMGVIPRAMQSIFRTLESRGDTESYVKASYLEIYNENLTDLLSTSSGADVPMNQQLRIIEDKSKIGRGVMVHNLEEVLVKSWEDIRKVMKMAMAKRRVAATDLNDRSSRSHAVFTVTVHSKEYSPEGEELLRVGKINLVDLAGSECVARSGSKDVRAREAGNINQSLLTLGRVITALVEKSPHIAYRDSKLTRLLQESLGGCSLTLMIATVAPSVHCLDETLSTLEYASRAKAIKNRPMANQKMTKRVAIKEYVEEIERLRLELQAARAKDGVYLPEDQYNQLVSSGKSTSIRVQDLEAILEKRMAELSEVRANYSQTSAELRKTLVELDTERDRLARTKDDLRRKESELDEERKVCEERQAIIDAHVGVESRLHLVHDELQERLKNAKERIHGLHEKIDRKHAVERDNDKLVTTLRSDVERKLLEIDVAVRDGKSVAFEGMSKVQEWLERFQRFVSEDAKQSHHTHRERYLETSQQMLDRMGSQGLKFAETDQSRISKEGVTNAVGFSEASSGFVEAGRVHGETISLARMATEQELETLRVSCIAPLIAEVERSKVSSNAFADSLLAATANLQDATRALVEMYERRMREMEEQMQRLVIEEKARSKKASERAQERIAVILASMTDDNHSELDKMMNSFASQRQNLMREGNENYAAVRSCFEMIQSSNTTWFEAETEQKQQTLREVRRMDLTAGAQAKAAWESVMERSEETLAYTRRGASDSAANKSRVESSTDIVLAELKERSMGIQSEIKTAKATLAEIHRVAVQEDNTMDERAMTLLTQSKRDLEDVRSSTDQFCTETISRVESTRGTIDQFHLKEDRPTGRTPSKLQPVDWTKERPQTEPHAKIVDRVRRGRGKATVLVDIEDNGMTNIKPKHVVTVKSQRSSLGGAETPLMERDLNVSVNVNEGDAIEGMKIQDLRSALKERGINAAGTKEILKQRLRRASLGESVVDSPVEESM